MRLIDVDALKESFGDQRLDGDWGIYGDETTARDLIDEAPIIDAEPVRHGKWEERVFHNGCTFDHDLFCSVCNHNYGSPEYEYCPYCGAKMDLSD